MLSINDKAAIGVREERGRGGYLRIACLSHLNIDPAFLSKRITVPCYGGGGGRGGRAHLLFALVS